MKLDDELKQAAILGYQWQLREIQQAIQDLQSNGPVGKSAATPAKEPTKRAYQIRKMSSEGKEKIARAQKKRWDAFRKAKKLEAKKV